MPRLLVTIDLPADIKLRVSCLFVEMRRVRRVKPENLHLTLHFIGAAEDAQTRATDATLACVVAASVALAFGIAIAANPDARILIQVNRRNGRGEYHRSRRSVTGHARPDRQRRHL